MYYMHYSLKCYFDPDNEVIDLVKQCGFNIKNNDWICWNISLTIHENEIKVFMEIQVQATE